MDMYVYIDLLKINIFLILSSNNSGFKYLKNTSFGIWSQWVNFHLHMDGEFAWIHMYMAMQLTKYVLS